jgi:hypothetical protein
MSAAVRLDRAAASSKTAVSGSHRYKYFKRPIMPRVSAIPPQILLAPTVTNENPLVPVEKIDESSVKDVAVQTAYRESEAQTMPYTPDYVVAKGQAPEILLLKKLTYENGLPLGKSEIEMIEYARAKRDMEINLPPFTDEASLVLRKKLMEHQEMKEYRLREHEIDSKRDGKLQEIHRALLEREESNEFMTSQRLESIRLSRMEEREDMLQKIRNKRIKALRRLAHQRNVADPVLSDDAGRDIINDYFDKGSKVYAPARRDGQDVTTFESAKFDVASRTVPLDSIGNIMTLEHTIPRRHFEDSLAGGPLMAKTAPFKTKERHGGGGRAAESRLTSAAARTQRTTKRDVEEMHQILMQKKLTAMKAGSALIEATGGSRPQTHRSADSSRPNTKAGAESTILTALLAKKPKGRPPTPDFTTDRLLKPADVVPVSEEEEEDEDHPPVPADTTNYELKNNRSFQVAVVLLQKLVRGRAVQNVMFEGKFRRRELITELKAAVESDRTAVEATSAELIEEQNARRVHNIKTSTIDMVAGSVSSTLITVLAQEQVTYVRPLYLCGVDLLSLPFSTLHCCDRTAWK